MTDWTTIYPDVDGSPIRGVPDEFEVAGNFFRDMQDSAQAIIDEFDRIKSDAGVDQLQGEAAEAFVGIVEDVKGSLAELPRVSGEAADLLHGHVEPLNDLRRRADLAADSALARARTNWNERNSAQVEVDAEQVLVDQYTRWISWLPAEGVDPDEDARRDRYERWLGSAVWRRNAAQGRVDEHQAALDAIRIEWDDLCIEEDELSRRLDRAIDDIRLANLSDPGRFSSFLNSAFGFVLALTPLDELYDLVSSIVVAALNGDWAAVLWKLGEILDAALLVLAVVALFTPIGPILAGVIFGLAVAKLAIDASLYATSTANPETGETKSGWDVAVSAIGVATAGYGAAAAQPGSTLGQGASVFGNRLNGTPSIFTGAGANAPTYAQGVQAVDDVFTGRDFVYFGIETVQQGGAGNVNPYEAIIPGPVNNGPIFRTVIHGEGTGNVLGAAAANGYHFDFELDLDVDSIDSIDEAVPSWPTGVHGPIDVDVDTTVPRPVIIDLDLPIFTTVPPTGDGELVGAGS